MRPPIDYSTFRAFILDHILAALGNDGSKPWTWTPGGVQSFEQLVSNMHYWIDYLAADIGNQVNSYNPVNKLPTEILTMIFAEAVEPFDIDERIALSDVCCHWREAIYNNKAFWTTIRLDETDRAASGDDMLAPFQWRLEHAEPALLNLDLRFRTGARSARLDEPLREHMHHVRSLVVDIRKNVLEEHWRTAFSMPAPHLSKLSITAQSHWTLGAHDREISAQFSRNMFADHAPRLQEMFLARVQLPNPMWSPLRSLTTLIYKASTIDASELARMVLACPSLRTLHFRAFNHFIAGEDARNPSQRTSVPDAGGPRLTSLAFWTWHTGWRTPLNFFLNRIRCHDPEHLFRSVHDLHSNTNRAWVMDAIRTDGMDELHISRCDAEAAGSLCATARRASGKTRSSWIEIPTLSGLFQAFAFITQLTFPETMWPVDEFPSIPNLRILTIVLEDPEQTRSDSYEMPGIFFLALRTGNSWYLPSLRSLHLAYMDAEADEDDANAVWGDRCYSGNPLVISAFEVAAFLRWNVDTGHPVRLVLQNVLLLEPSDSASMRQLNSLIEELVIEPVYSPRSFNVVSLL